MSSGEQFYIKILYVLLPKYMRGCKQYIPQLLLSQVLICSLYCGTIESVMALNIIL